VAARSRAGGDKPLPYSNDTYCILFNTMPVCKTCGNNERFKGQFKGENPLKFVCSYNKSGELIDIAIVKEKEPDKVRPNFIIEACYNCGSKEIEFKDKAGQDYLVPCEKCQVKLKIKNPVNGKRYNLRCPKCNNTFYHVVFLDEDYWKGFDRA